MSRWDTGTGRPPVRRTDPARPRAWLVAAIAVLLVLLYLSVSLTYASSHLPPARFHPTAPGAVAHGKYADFRLLSLRQTERWGQDADGAGGSPDPGAVWVVGRLEVTPRRHEDYQLCTLTVVSTDGRSWASDDLGPTHDGESCVPDPENVHIGTTYPFVVGFQVPIVEADHIAGLGLDLNSWRAYPLLRPPA
ncbi:MAG: hypothetical protein ACRYG2_32245 [Janthinobacterium lividum]